MRSSRRRRCHLIWRYHLFFAIGLILAVYNWLTLMPVLWWSDINRDAAIGLIWYVMAQVGAFWLLWRWLGPLMRGRQQRP